MNNLERISMPLIEANTGQIEGLPKNPRFIRDEKFAKLKQSIQDYPEMLEARSLLVYPQSGRYIVIGGNMRYRAMLELGFTEAPCYVIPSETDVERLKAYTIIDNGDFGQWDWDLLANEWDEDLLEDWGVDFSTFDDLEKELDKDDDEASEDDFDEESDHIAVRCKRGDIWQLGDHRLMCGDSIELEEVKRLMGGVMADMVFTDPPYGVSYTDKNEFLNGLGKPIACPKPIENDHKKPTEMYDFWLKAFTNLHECTKEKMSYYITAPQGGDLLLLLQSLRDAGFALKHMLVWNKNNHVLGRCDYNYKHEPIIYGWKLKGTHTFYGGSEFKTSVWDIDKPLKNDLHPTMKPVKLVVSCLLDATKEGDVVLDLFGGSGTTIIAAEQSKRRAMLMEYDPHYCDVIIARWEKLTGKEAIKIN